MVASALNVFQNRVAVALLRRYNVTATRFVFPKRPCGLPKCHRYAVRIPETPLRATKMSPLRGSYSRNALAGYQNATATRFVFPKRPCGLPKCHRYAVRIPETPLRATKMPPLRGSYSRNALAGYQNATATRF